MSNEALIREIEQKIVDPWDCMTGTLLDLLIRCHAALKAQQAPASDSWQPIETAPKDGTSMLVHSKDGWIGRVRWNQDEEIFEDEHTEFVSEEWLDHWMPLPPPPQQSNSSEKKL